VSAPLLGVALLAEVAVARLPDAAVVTTLLARMIAVIATMIDESVVIVPVAQMIGKLNLTYRFVIILLTRAIGIAIPRMTVRKSARMARMGRIGKVDLHFHCALSFNNF
jgi:hypothetical protein